MAKKTPKGKKPKATKPKDTKPKRTTKIMIGCKAGWCTASAKHTHISGPGSQVELLATTTNVTVAFDRGKSPFEPNVPIIHLAMGVPAMFTVSSSAWGDYPYQIACIDPNPCPTPQDEPDMIVP